MMTASTFAPNDIKIEIGENIAYVTINRPKALNALTCNAKKELSQFFEDANEAEDFKAIVLTGAGDRAFCAGTDLKEMSGFGGIDFEQMLWLEHRMYDAIRYCNKPVIAAVNGIALGGGGVLALVCDYSVVSDSAALGFPEINTGLPASIEIAIIHKFVGLAKAREMVYFGETFTPREALEMKLINRVVAKEDVLRTAKELALKLLRKSPTALRMQKELINKWIESDFVSSVETSIYAAGLAFTTGEPQAVMTTFLNRKNKSSDI
jgi:enoyl-CoA hydratase